MFFTGPWEDLFRSEMLRDTTTDFLSVAVYEQNDGWYHMKRCRTGGQKCRCLGSLQVLWMTARVSSILAKSLEKDLYDGKIEGHHEAVVGGYCNSHGFKLGEIDRKWVGRIRTGHNRKEPGWLGLDLETLKPEPGKLVHPVKCAAYH